MAHRNLFDLHIHVACDRGVRGSHNSSKLIGIFNTTIIMPFNKISKRSFTFTSMDVTSVVYTTKRFNTNINMYMYIYMYLYVAVPLSPLNKREVLKTPYILIWSVAVVISAPR